MLIIENTEVVEMVSGVNFGKNPSKTKFWASE